MNLRSLNAVQRAAVEATEGPVLIFAGAGSGKTRVLTYKIANLINTELYEPQDILAVTFTNKAAQEMKSRVLSLLKTKDLTIDIGTFHSTCARLLRSEIHRLGFISNFTIYDTNDQLILMKIVLNNLAISKDMVTPKMALQYISNNKNKMISPEEAQSGARIVMEQKLAQVYPAYQKALRVNNALDFDDLLIQPLILFEKYPAVLKKYQKRWKYILVDEYQDTNRPQFVFVSNLAARHHQICVVGDDDQSIYGWRGADIRNILDFENIFPDCKVFKLEKNYRSTQKILDAATAVVQNNKNRTPKKLYSINGSGSDLGLIETMDELEEADAVVSALEKEIKLHKRTFSDFAVLYRTNAQSRALEDSLRQSAIPYNIVGGIRFYERKEIKELLAYLQLITNLRDTVALRRIVNFPPRGIGLKTVDKCVKQAVESNKELFEVLEDPTQMDIRGKQADSLKAFHVIIQKFHDLIKKLNPSELVRALVEETGVLQYYKTADNPEDQDRYDNVLELLNSIDGYSARNTNNTLEDFLEEVSLLTNIDEWNNQENRITLMTVHAAKGLEFPIVFITGLEDGLFPLYNSMNNQRDMEEERRLFYVALTRAKEKVYLMYATQRRRIGTDYDLGLVSRFIRELPEDHLENISFASALTRKVVRITPGLTKVEVTRTVTDFDDFKVGDFVEHAIFGIGKIMALSGTGENQRVGVVFKGGEKKKLIVKYANLKKVEDTPES